MDLRDRFLGAILGCAAGDALGAPYEGRSRSFMLKQRGLASKYEKMAGYPAGQYTDDTQMTLALCESIINRRKIDGRDIAGRFASLWRSGSIIGEGAACRDAMLSIIAGGSNWDEAGAGEGRAGNGSAMRTSPVGLFDCRDMNALKRDAVIQSSITHRDKRAAAGAVAVSAAVARCTGGEKINAVEFLGFIHEAVNDISTEFADSIKDLEKTIKFDEEEAFEKIASYGIETSAAPEGITPFVIQTVSAALYHFLRKPNDWAGSVEGALRFGGDTDTVASITGAISGCLNGYKAIPENLVENLKDSEYIHGMALNLYDAYNTNLLSYK